MQPVSCKHGLCSLSLHRIWNKKSSCGAKGSIGLCDGVSPSLAGLVKFPLSATSTLRVINSVHTTHTGKQHLMLISSSRPLKSNAVVSVLPSLPLSLTSNMLSAAILLSGFYTPIAPQWSTYHWSWHAAHCPSFSVFQLLSLAQMEALSLMWW